MMNGKYGVVNWETSDKELSQLKKYADRAFEPAERPAEPEPNIEPPAGPVE